MNAGKAVLAERGFFGLYGGCAINLFLITPEKAIKLVVNDEMRSRLKISDEISAKNLIAGAVAGATAGACQCIITSPMEMAKIAGQTGTPLKTLYNQRTAGRVGFIGCTQGIYTGFCATLVRDVPFSVLYFPAFAWATKILSDKLNRGKKSKSIEFTAGLFCALISAFLVTPMDCIKTRIQKKGGISWQSAGRQIWNEGYAAGGYTSGMQALFNGGLARGIVVGFLFGAAQVVYGYCPTERLLGFEH